MRRMGEGTAGRLAFGAIGAAMLALLVYYARVELIDDAYISFRYARNLLDGHGLVFNAGERVEGYTNFLWVMLLAGAARVGFGLEAASQWMGAAAGLGTLWATGAFFPAAERPAWTRLTAPALLVGSAALAMWSVHGLETALFTLLVTLGLRTDTRALRAGRADWRPALLYALATLTRPEGALVFAVSVGFGVLFGGRVRRSLQSLAPLLLYVAVVGVHVAWRYTYYGDVVPNTFHAKVGLSFGGAGLVRGLRYLDSFLQLPGAAVFLFWLPAVWAARHDRALGLLACVSVAYLTAIVLEGGDAFGGYRFLVPILPALYLGVQEGFWLTWCALRERAPGTLPRSALATLSVLVLLGGLHAWQASRNVQWETRGANRFMREVIPAGHALRAHFPPDTTLALNAAGAIPYITGFRTYDMLGLTDAHIARTEVGDMGAGLAGHEKGDGAYILERRPDLILLGNVRVTKRPLGPDTKLETRGRTENEIAEHPDFARLYRFEELELADGRYLIYARLRD